MLHSVLYVTYNKPLTPILFRIEKGIKTMSIHNQWNMAKRALEVSDRVCLYGPPGTGKSHLSFNCIPKGKDVVSITLTEEMTDSQLLGFYMPEGDGFKWHNGIILNGILNESRIVINEIDHASPSCQSILHSLLDSPDVFCLTLPTGETLKNKKFQVIATMNGQLSDLRPAIADRFPVKVEITEPNPEAVKLLPPYMSMLATQSISYEQEKNISLRSWFEVFKLWDSLKSLSEACFLVFGERGEDIAESILLHKSEYENNQSKGVK